MEDGGETLEHLTCGGYVFHMSDGSRFDRLDVSPVRLAECPPPAGRQVVESKALSPACDKRKRDTTDETGTPHRKRPGSGRDLATDAYEDGYHCCVPSDVSLRLFAAEGGGGGCPAWRKLSEAQRAALTEIQAVVDADRAAGRYFTCVVLEGPGGCGKTRLMSHVMNHKARTSLVVYVTKQNKRVQDFLRADCLAGETADGVRPPADLTACGRELVVGYLGLDAVGGRFASTTDKLVTALTGRTYMSFTQDARWSELTAADWRDAAGAFVDRATGVSDRNVIILMDEYSMHQTPLICTVAAHVARVSCAPVLLVMAGDRFQCGPIGWKGPTTGATDADLFTNDVRREIADKLGYRPSDVTMENLERCKNDAHLGACVRRLRRVCAQGDGAARGAVVNAVVARFATDSGVGLYRLDTWNEEGGGRRTVPILRLVLPADPETLGPTVGGDDGEEEFDERGVDFRFVAGDELARNPLCPAYDLLPLADHFGALYGALAEAEFAGGAPRPTDGAVYGSAEEVRGRCPVFVVLKNVWCNVLAETLMLGLYGQVRRRLLARRVRPPRYEERRGGDGWSRHVESFLRRHVRCLPIDDDDPLGRLTLFVGMVYKMTDNCRTYPATGAGLSKGELVVLTSISFGDPPHCDALEAVVVRKLADDRTEFRLQASHGVNRLTKDKKVAIIPFVPYLSENIYQMQGNTMPKTAASLVDLTGADCNSVYVALSRFQTSEAIRGIVLT